MAALDADPAALDTHAANLATPTLRTDLRVSLPAPGEPVDVIIAGPPCQGFSLIGKRDSADPRNSLLLVPVIAARLLQPRVVVIENVAGAGSGGMAVHWENARSALIADGYKTATLTIDMRAHGVPQIRRRMLMLAWKGSGELRMHLPERKPVSLGAALRGVARLADHQPRPLTIGSRAEVIARHVKAGQRLCNVRGLSATTVRTWDIPEVFGAVSESEREVLEALALLRRRERTRNFGDADAVSIIRLEEFTGRRVRRDISRLVRRGFVRPTGVDLFDLAHTFNGKYRRPKLDGVAPAVDSRVGDAHYVLHPRENRGFSHREAARIQGFPDWFRFSGTARQKYVQIANAVPPPAAADLGRFVYDAFDWASEVS